MLAGVGSILSCLQEEDACLIQLQNLVDSHPDDPSHHFSLGLFLWKKSEGSKEIKGKAAEHFVISVKSNPHNADAFRYLGHFYSGVLADTKRALKCYQRAVVINPDDSQSGDALCDLLDKSGMESLQYAVCREASGKSPKAFWAFQRLGYLQVFRKEWSEAVHSLQHAIRGYPTCVNLWEALGLAYQRLGMFTAALKSYERAVGLEGSNVFALVGSGNILLMLGSYRKGIEHFQQALKICPQCLSASYGLASALLGMSKDCINLGAFRWGASLLEVASGVAKEGTRLAGNLSCIWKLLGDIQLSYAKSFPWMEEGLGNKTDKESFNDSILSWKKTCCTAAVSASGSYQRALHLAPWQANLYSDIAIASDLICLLMENSKFEQTDWNLAEKMSLGGILLEGYNSDFWVALGCVAHHRALQQHAFIRGLQLDVSLAVAWAYLGKIYRKEGVNLLARQAFDCARSFDPIMGLAWAGMSADTRSRMPRSTANDAYECCLKAVQILPLAEFQIGLANLALLSDNLFSPQVFGAIRQAVQRAPQYPESHNLNGLVFESRFDYQSAIYSYRLARCAIGISSGNVEKSLITDVSINLARSLSKAGGGALDAVQECEYLNQEGLLDAHGLQIYAFSLWQLGKNDIALSVVKTLASSISSLEPTSQALSVCFICKLYYYIYDQESVIKIILKMPNELFQSSRVSFILTSINALDQRNRLDSIVSSSHSFLISQDDIIGMHFLIALSTLMKNGPEHHLEYQSGVLRLKKSLHMFPNSRLLRNLLGYLLLCRQEWNDVHNATRCCIIDYSDIKSGVKSAYEILGAGTVACYVAAANPKNSFSTCKYRCPDGPQAIRQLQKWYHQEPWNHKARYLVILNLVQKARERRFPQHLLASLKQMIVSCELYSGDDDSCEYQRFQLLLCASEVSFHAGNLFGSIEFANTASAISVPKSTVFFAHLLLCRAYATMDDGVGRVQEEYVRCVQCKTRHCIGWICLVLIKYQYKLEGDPNSIESSLMECLRDVNKGSRDVWMGVFYYVRGLICLQRRDFVLAEEYCARACSLAISETLFFLCHGWICMELAREKHGGPFLSLAVRSLKRARESSLPISSMLLAQAEASLGSKPKWEQNLQLEWLSWPPERREAEIYFQMHLLAKECKAPREFSQSPTGWILRAIHLNPSCLKYWLVLHKLLN